MAEEQLPFADVVFLDDGAFSIPSLKWRELLFIGALHPEGKGFVRDPARPLPRFHVENLFPLGVCFEAEPLGGRVVIRRRGMGGP